jgi:hypothetical protein
MDLKRMKNLLMMEKRPFLQSLDCKILEGNEFNTLRVVDRPTASSLEPAYSTDWVPLALKLPILH